MDKITKDHNLSQSENIVETNIDKLKALFPEIVTEGKIDFKVLQEVLGNELEEGEEYYRFTWAGKANARREAQKPSTGTLRPAPEESTKRDGSAYKKGETFSMHNSKSSSPLGKLDGASQNLYIEGDNLEVLKLLQKGYSGKVKMIYIDPPYNTGKDFVYKDNYKDNLRNYQEITGQLDDEGNKLSTNSDSDGRYHSNWLNMMYPRLKLARNLLKEDGLIFMSIGDHEMDSLRKIGNEIFGEDCHLATFIWNTDGHTDNQLEVKVNHEYIICFKRNPKGAVLNPVIDPNTRKDSNLWKGFAENSITKNGPKNPPSEVILKKGFPCKTLNLSLDISDVGDDFFNDVKRIKHISREITKKYDCSYPIRLDAMLVKDGELQEDCRVFAGWANNAKLKKFIETGFQPLIEDDGIVTFFLSENGVIYYHKERDSAKNILSVLRNFKTTEKMRSELENQQVYFTYPKPNDLLQYLCDMSLDNDELMIDFFSGSASSADAMLRFNSSHNKSANFILVQLPEETPVGSLARENGYNKITEIGKERIRKVAKQITEEHPEKAKDLDLGFKVFKLDTSNIKGWDGNPDNLDESLFDTQDNIKTDRTEYDVLYEILLKYGLDLTLPIEEKDISTALDVTKTVRVFSVGYGALFICLADNITNAVAQGIGEWKEELQPEVCRVVFKDSGFTDVEKTNSIQTLKRFGISEIKSI